MDLQTELGYMRINGWCLLEGIIPADKVDAVRNSVEAAVSAHQSTTAPDDIGHVPGLIRFEQSFAPYLVHPRLLGLVEALLGQHVRVSFTTAQINFPGNDRGGWHADWPFNQETAGHVPAPYPDVVMHVTTLWLLSPFNEENGGTYIVPGSHRANNNPSGDNGIDPTQP
ncbi:MAG: phytanoyl-CoA dioxygenase family protein, partial [Chloroflexota bacterium]|nr:phytanoyl-CoA dioxygenase family protein [Chloroflexota bacterium]